MRRNSVIALFCVVLALGAIVKTHQPPQRTARDTLCAGPPLRTAEARLNAVQRGYSINRDYDCIEKVSAAELAVEEAARPPASAEAPTVTPSAPPIEAGGNLAQVRRGFRTAISQRTGTPRELPTPPATLFTRTDYPSASLTLAAYLTPDPRDGKKHPAIVWLTGGDSNSLDDFWSPRPESDDESASAFRNAGMVMMFPTLRGGNTNAGGKEYMLGEVDDVLAAADYLARQSYVDPNQIYLGGHSTGGTLALLTAETSGRFKAVFAFGPVGSVDRYSALFPVNFDQHPELERRLRSPIYWLDGITSPTYLIEGGNPPGNIGELEAICAKSHNPQVHCIRAEGSDHFSVLSRVSRVIAARLSVANEIAFTLQPAEFGKGGGRD